EHRPDGVHGEHDAVDGRAHIERVLQLGVPRHEVREDCPVREEEGRGCDVAAPQRAVGGRRHPSILPDRHSDVTRARYGARMAEIPSADPPHPSAAADSEALPVLGLQKQLPDRPAKRSTIFSWALWDWGLQPFNTIIVTFIFTALYLTTDAFLPADLQALADDDPIKEAALADLASGLGLGTTIAGLLILAVAPVLGQQADAQGRQKLWLGIGTAGTIACMLALWFAEPAPTFFWFAVIVISAGTVLSEIGTVNSNA